MYIIQYIIKKNEPFIKEDENDNLPEQNFQSKDTMAIRSVIH